MHGRVDDIQFIDLGLFGAFSSIISLSFASATYLGKPLKTWVNKLDIVSLPCVNIYLFVCLFIYVSKSLLLILMVIADICGHDVGRLLLFLVS